MQNIRAEVLLPTTDLTADLGFFTKRLGFRMDEIMPADDPREAVLSGYGLRVRLDQTLTAPAGTLRILGDEPKLIAGGETELTAPGGTQVQIAALNPPVVTPPAQHTFVVRRLKDDAPWVVGRAGMEYRDLIPDRLGGSIIASHIRIPGGGPVPDMVHYHSVGFQLIFCIQGWVDLVYEDQGPPFRLHAGNCVIQPPEIRHRVLFASDNLEVVEIGVPAEHLTTIDHQMELPTQTHRPDRAFSGQTFVHHVADQAVWAPARLPGWRARDSQIAAHTGGVADVQVLQHDGQAEATGWVQHEAEVYFAFVLAGSVALEARDQAAHSLEAGDACAIPPGLPYQFRDATPDCELLQVALPGTFALTTP